jgi:hypothetical protein
MTAGTTVRAPARIPGAVGRGAGSIGAARHHLAQRAVGLARTAGSTVAAALDGLAVGLVVGYVVGVFVSGGTKHLGLPLPLEWAITGLGASTIVMAGAAAAIAARRSLVFGGSLADRVLARIAPPWRRATRVRSIVTAPARLLRALPVGWLGALATALLVANLGATAGPLALFIPAGSLGPYVVIGGAVTALGAAARHLGRDPGPAQRPHPAHRTGGPGRLLGRLDGQLAGALALAPGLPGRARRLAAIVFAGAAVVLTSYGGLVMASPGTVAHLVAPDPAFDGALPAANLADPGARGPYGVRTLSYGNGADPRRPAYGANAALRTPTVDGSSILQPLGWGADEAREWFWGFGRDALPINGLAWLPEGPGPFPLVLVVHGNHAMGDFSEPGYAYLGEHLASRGFITVSVDEDFLNGSWASDWGGTEQLARAWLLLLHLDQWRGWSEDPANPLHGLIDIDRVALMGHSRGGEAASVAASLAGRTTAPAPGLAPWPTGLRVRAVVAIAPSDGQFGGGPVVLKGTDFLTLHGGHDSDATSWMGIRQYARTVVGEGGFKAALWSYRANHGQFNTAWGRSDLGDLGGATLNLAPIQDAADQEDVAKTSIGAFLEASLLGRVEYRELFRRPMLGREWLPPDDIYLVRSAGDPVSALLSGHGGRGVDGITVTASGFESSAGRTVPLRALLPDQLTRGIELRWAVGQAPATWTVDGLGGADGGAATGLQLSLANGAVDHPGRPALLDPSVELTTTDGITVALPLSRWGALPPPLEVVLVKDELLAGLGSMDVAQGAPVERVLQTYDLPFAEFAAADPRFEPAQIASMRLVIDRRVAGSLWVAEVGLLIEG